MDAHGDLDQECMSIKDAHGDLDQQVYPHLFVWIKPANFTKVIGNSLSLPCSKKGQESA